MSVALLHNACHTKQACHDLDVATADVSAVLYADTRDVSWQQDGSISFFVQSCLSDKSDTLATFSITFAEGERSSHDFLQSSFFLLRHTERSREEESLGKCKHFLLPYHSISLSLPLYATRSIMSQPILPLKDRSKRATDEKIRMSIIKKRTGPCICTCSVCFCACVRACVRVCTRFLHVHSSSSCEHCGILLQQNKFRYSLLAKVNIKLCQELERASEC